MVSLFRKVNAGDSGIGSPPNSNSSGATVLRRVVRSETPRKFAILHTVILWVPVSSVMLQTRVVTFSVPSKFAITDPLGGAVSAAPKPEVGVEYGIGLSIKHAYDYRLNIR